MMKRIHTTMMAGLGALILAGTGCVSYHSESASQNLERPSRMGGSSYFTQYDVAKEKVKAESSAKVWFWLFTSGDPKFADIEAKGFWDNFVPRRIAINKAKSAATYEACDRAKADHLLGATYRYKMTDYFFVQEINCEASGFPATAKEIKWLDRKPYLIDKNKELIYLQPHENVTDLSSASGAGSSSWWNPLDFLFE